LTKQKIFIFTSNKKKLREIKKILFKKKYIFCTIKDFKKIILPKESGKTFKENAMIKSKFGYKISKIPCVADDSGICISALGDKPGIRSDRYQKRMNGYKKTFEKIAKEVIKSNKNSAYFKTVISFTYKKNKTITFEGIKRGTIVKKPVGKNGFGYDPIFKPLKCSKTYAQMSNKEKNSISHRGRALKKFSKGLKKLIY